MSKVKAIAAALLISVCASTVSFAEVNNFHEEDTNWKIDYPVVTVGANESAQDAINSDIMNYVGQLRSDFESGKYYTCSGKYTVHYEDDDVLSLSLYFLRLPYGANGNHVTSYDLVYDKTTGERIPLENYVRITLTDLKQYLGGHSYSYGGKILRGINGDYVESVPSNYFLEGNGVVCLVFQPYQLAAGCFGNCYVRLEPQYIEYLNRKNQW